MTAMASPMKQVIDARAGTTTGTKGHIIPGNSCLKMTNAMDVIDGTTSIMWQETCYWYVCAKNSYFP